MSSERVEALEALISAPRRQEQEFVQKIKPIPTELFSDDIPICRLAGYSETFSEEYNRPPEMDKLDEFLESSGLTPDEIMRIDPLLRTIAFPWIDGVAAKRIVLTIGDVKEVVSRGLLSGIDGFEKSLDRIIIKRLFA